MTKNTHTQTHTHTHTHTQVSVDDSIDFHEDNGDCSQDSIRPLVIDQPILLTLTLLIVYNRASRP